MAEVIAEQLAQRISMARKGIAKPFLVQEIYFDAGMLFQKTADHLRQVAGMKFDIDNSHSPFSVEQALVVQFGQKAVRVPPPSRSSSRE